MNAISAAGPAAQRIKGYCGQCKARCGTVALVSSDNRLIAVQPDRDHPNRGFCVKGAAAPQIVHHPRRLFRPLRRTTPKTSDDPGWTPISWDEALDTVADRLRDIATHHGPEAVAFTRPAPGGSHSGDWAPYLVRLAESFGSPNLITTSHICSWGRNNGVAYTFGSSLPTAHYEAARTMLVWGHNPAASHIQTWRRIREAQKCGARLVVVDPRATKTAERADLWIRPRPGSDAALALGVIHLLLTKGHYDAEFVALWTNGPFLVDRGTGRLLRGPGPDEYLVCDRHTGEVRVVNTRRHPTEWGVEPALTAADAPLGPGGPPATTAFRLLVERAAQYPPAVVSRLTQVPERDLHALADAIGTGGPVCYDTYNGVEQHTDTGQTARALAVMYALIGWLQAEGGNVSFAAADKSGSGLLPPEQLTKRLGLAERPLGAPKQSIQAYTFYDAVLEGRPYPLRALVAFGGDTLVQNGDTLRGRRAFQALDFHVHVDMFENPTARFADILLPAASCWESPAVVTTFGGGPDTQFYAQYRPAVVPPVGESRPDMDIIFDLARRLGVGEHFHGGDVHAELEHKAARAGLTLDELKRNPRGVALPHPPLSFRAYARVDGSGHVAGFRTPTRKVELYSETFLLHGHDPLPAANDRSAFFTDEYPLTLTSYKLIQYIHSSGRGIPALRKQAPEPYVEIHPVDAEPRGIVDGAMVRLSTPSGSIVVRAKVCESVIPGVVATQTGWWEGCTELGLGGHDPFSADGANVNLVITNDVLDPISGSVPVKDYPCRVEPVDPSQSTSSERSALS